MSNLFWWVLVGLVSGWLAGEIMRGRGFGCLGNIIIGLVGAVIGGYVFSALKIELAGGFINAVITALVGAVLLLAVGNILGPGKKR